MIPTTSIYQRIIDKAWTLTNKDGRSIIANIQFSSDSKINNSNFSFAHTWYFNGGHLYIIGEDSFSTILFDVSSLRDEGIKADFESYDKKYRLVERTTPYALTEIEKKLIGNWWVYRAGDGHIYGEVFFEADGRIVGYEHPNEYAWGFEGDQLYFLSKDGNVTIVFEPPVMRSTGELFFTRDIEDKEWRVTLEPVVSETEVVHSRLYAELCLTPHDKSNTLMIIFNSADCIFSNEEVTWEFYSLPISERVDYLRMAESSDPGWYIDKKDEVIGLMESCAKKYKKIIVLGVGTGGFAAILYAEMLAKHYGGKLIRTFTINPQTDHSEKMASHMREQYQRPHRGRLISDERFMHADISLLSLVKNMQDSSGNLRHKIYYDSGSLVEKDYLVEIGYFEHVDFKSYSFGYNHSDAIWHIYNEGEILTDIIDFINLNK